MKGQKEYRFSITVEKNDPYGIVAKWLSQLGTKEKNESVLKAIKSFYEIESLLFSRDRFEKELSKQESWVLLSIIETSVSVLKEQVEVIQGKIGVLFNPSQPELLAIKKMKKDPIKICLRYRNCHPTEQLIFSHLKKMECLELKSKILFSVEAFWGAIAAQETNELNEENLKAYANSNLYRLMNKINYWEDTKRTLIGKTEENDSHITNPNHNSVVRVQTNGNLCSDEEVSSKSSKDNQFKSKRLSSNFFDSLIS